MIATYILWISGELSGSHPQRMTAGEEAEAGPWGDKGSTGRVDDVFRHASAFQADFASTRARSAVWAVFTYVMSRC